MRALARSGRGEDRQLAADLVRYLSERSRDVSKTRLPERAGPKRMHRPVLSSHIVDLNILKADDYRIALDVPVIGTQSGRHVTIHCSPGSGRAGLFTVYPTRRLLTLPGAQGTDGAATYPTGRWTRRDHTEVCSKEHILACLR